MLKNIKVCLKKTLKGAPVSQAALTNSAASMQNQYYTPSGYNNAGRNFRTSMTYTNPVLQKVSVEYNYFTTGW